MKIKLLGLIAIILTVKLIVESNFHITSILLIPCIISGVLIIKYLPFKESDTN